MLISLQNFISALEWTAKTSALFSKHKNKTWWPDNAVFCIHISLTFVLNTQANQRGKLRADGPSLLIAFLLFLAHTITHFSLTLMSHLHFSFPCPSGVKSLTFAGNWCWVTLSFQWKMCQFSGFNFSLPGIYWYFVWLLLEIRFFCAVTVYFLFHNR